MASLAKRRDGRWRARYRDAADKEHSRHFARKLDAPRWLDDVTASVVIGQYVDPKAGRVTFETYDAEWGSRQVWEATNVLAMDLAASSAPFAQLPLAELRRSHVEQWIEQMARPRRTAHVGQQASCWPTCSRFLRTVCGPATCPQPLTWRPVGSTR